VSAPVVARGAGNGVSTPAVTLTILIGILAAAASSIGALGGDRLYRDNPFVTSTWLGTDLVTLVVAVPLLFGALTRARRRSLRAVLVWLGILDSMLYNYAFYLFGAAFNRLFLVYTAIVGLAIWALVLGLAGLEVGEFRHPAKGAPDKVIAGFMLVVGLGLASVYVAQWTIFADGGAIPPIITRTGHPTNVVFALDLTLVVPVLVVGAIWLWRRHPWGCVVATIINVKGALSMVGLSAATVTAYRAGTVETLAELLIWGPIGLGCAIAATVLLRALPTHRELK
jgi:hypothetical protein